MRHGGFRKIEAVHVIACFPTGGQKVTVSTADIQNLPASFHPAEKFDPVGFKAEPFFKLPRPWSSSLHKAVIAIFLVV
jgi:hypothetical protein